MRSRGHRSPVFANILFYFTLVSVVTPPAHALDSISFDQFEHDVRVGKYRGYRDEHFEVVHVHFEGVPSRLPERVLNTLLRLRSQGFLVEGAFLEGGLDDVTRDLIASDRAGTTRTHYLELAPLRGEDGGLSRRAALRRMTGSLGKFFGLSVGINGPGEIRALPKREHLSLLAITQGLQFLWLGYRGLPNVILATYLYGYLGNLDGIRKIKNSGGTLRVDPSRLDERQFWIEPNYRWVTTQTTLEDLLIFTAMRLAIKAKSQKVQEPLAKVVGDPALSAFAKSLTEEVILRIWNLEQEARVRGDEEGQKKYKQWIMTIQILSYNVLFPNLRNGQMPTATAIEKLVSYGVLAAMGLAGLGREYLWKRKVESLPEMAPDCAFLLSFEKGRTVDAESQP
jgi:hypothetical protein